MPYRKAEYRASDHWQAPPGMPLRANQETWFLKHYSSEVKHALPQGRVPSR
jgi:hypothetical protein